MVRVIMQEDEAVLDTEWLESLVALESLDAVRCTSPPFLIPAGERALPLADSGSFLRRSLSSFCILAMTSV